MPYIVVIDKNGVVSDTLMKQFNEDELYKKAGFKTSKNFECIRKHCWSIKYNNIMHKISVYGKTDGRESTINKYELPPPLDILPLNKPHIYGPILIVNEDENGVVHDIKTSQWIQLYDYLIGGVEETEEDDDEEDDEEAKNPDKNGYEKDDFLVSDGEGEDEEDDDEEDEEDSDSGDEEEGEDSDDLCDDEEDDREFVPVEQVKSTRVSRKREAKKVKSDDFDYCEEELDFEEYFE